MYEEEDDYDRPRRRRDEGTSGKAIASLILGILSFCIPILGSIAAILLGVLGLVDISRSRGRLRGTGLAVGGIVTACIAFLTTPFILIALLLPAVQKVREAANRVQSSNNMRQIGLAIHNYHDTYGCFPPAVVYGPEGQPLYSWRVLLLPFLEQDALYRQFKLDEPWDSPHNKPLLAFMPRVYIHPDQGQPAEPYATYYQVFTGGGAIFDTDPKAGRRTFASITDGTANTILLVEAADPVPWSQPVDLPYSPNEPLPQFHGYRTFNVVMADGSYHSIPKDMHEGGIRALITANGGEMVDVPGAMPPPKPASKPPTTTKKKSNSKRSKEVFK
jgi:hypothetical protein